MSGQLYMGESGPACIVLGVAELGATDLPTTCLKDHMVLVGFGRVGSRLGEELQREEQPFLIIEDHTHGGEGLGQAAPASTTVTPSGTGKHCTAGAAA